MASPGHDWWDGHICLNIHWGCFEGFKGAAYIPVPGRVWVLMPKAQGATELFSCWLLEKRLAWGSADVLAHAVITYYIILRLLHSCYTLQIGHALFLKTRSILAPNSSRDALRNPFVASCSVRSQCVRSGPFGSRPVRFGSVPEGERSGGHLLGRDHAREGGRGGGWCLERWFEGRFKAGGADGCSGVG